MNGESSGEKEMMKEVEKLLRISPFGRRKRMFDAKCGGAVGQGGLLDRCIEVVCDTIDMQRDRGLECLPDDLMQLIVDRLIATERLNGETAVLLRGGTFYALNVDGYPMDALNAGGCGAWWLDNMFPVTLESVILSRTPVDDFFVANLPEMPRLKKLHLDCCERITDGSLNMLSGTPMLEDLSLMNCRGITSIGVALIGELKELKRLSLESCLKVSGLQHLMCLSNLKELNLGCCHGVTDRDAECISFLVNLETLVVKNTKIGDIGILSLRSLTRLKRLSVSGLNVNDSALATAVFTMKSLREFDASRCFSVGPRVLHSLANMHAGGENCCLEKLNLTYTAVNDQALDHAMPSFVALRSLHLESCDVSSAGMASLGQLVYLEELNLADTRICNTALKHLENLRQLEKLDVSFTMADDYGLHYIAKAKSLKHLNLESGSFTDTGISHIARLEVLETLDLFGSRITDKGCSIIAQMKTLKSLDISSGEITSYGVNALTRLKELVQLSLAHNHRISDGSIPSLLSMTQLTSLNLSQCQLSNAALSSLGALRNLKILCVADIPIKANTLKKILNTNPSIEIKGLKNL
jgi:Leucine-rich repeat (LRR) protein